MNSEESKKFTAEVDESSTFKISRVTSSCGTIDIVSDNNDVPKNLENVNIPLENCEYVEPMEKHFLLEMCRVCANKNDHIIPIFEGEGAEHDLSSKIHKYLPIRVSKNDTLPLQLCYHCAATILAWHDLIEGCEDAEKRLLRMESELREKHRLLLKDSEVLSSNELEGINATSEELVDDPEPIASHKQEEICQIEKEEEPSITVEGTDSPKCKERLAATKLLDPLTSGFTDFQKAYVNLFGTSRKDKIKSLESEDVEFNNDKTVTNNCDRRILKSRMKSTGPYTCTLCNKKFRLRDSLKTHERIHSGEKEFTCHICGKQFAQTGCLYYHLKHVHAGVKNHSCDICGRSFAMKTTMEDHRRSIHTGERPFVCDSCGKTFKTKSSLYIHSKIHTENYPHECKYCKKVFRWKQQLLGHLTIHTGEKKHSCDVCGKAFGVKNHLTRHKRTHSIEKPYACQECDMSFGQKRYLTTHQRSKHR